MGNILNGSNYGMWLGYSWNGNVVKDNVMGNCSTAGIAIEHGRGNVIDGNVIADGMNNGIMLWTDLQIHFPMSQYQCLNITDQAHSNSYMIRNNWIIGNKQFGIQLMNTTNSTVYNNYIDDGMNGGKTAEDIQSNVGNKWNVMQSKDGAPNIVGGPYIGGNYYSDYDGKDCGNGFGCTSYNDTGLMGNGGDQLPLIKQDQ